MNNPGAYVGPWRNETVPYMVEPMDELAARRFEGEIMVAPAQTAKTDALILNWLGHNIRSDAMDMVIYSPTMAMAKDFSMRRIDRFHRHSPEFGRYLLTGRDDDNIYDKTYTNGIMLSLGWPTISQVAGRPIGRVAITDYDRIADDIGGDGAMYDLASKRTETFGSFKMTLAESSPSRPLEQPRWVRVSPHEAPPCKGILSLYNRGDRRRWYWPCPKCEHYFVGAFEQLTYEIRETPLATAETVRMTCPHCGEGIRPRFKRHMNALGRWLKDGQRVGPDGIIRGEGARSSIASFWLNGTASAFQSWISLVANFLNADAEYKRTGGEEALTKFYNNDVGEPYIPKSVEIDRSPEALKERAEHWEPEGSVPLHVRTIIGLVDVQQNMFVVHVVGISPGDPYDLTVIDTFRIVKSNRVDVDGDTEWVKPATFLEDWDLLESLVMSKEYPLADGSNRKMRVKLVACDSGGKAGTTGNAYQFWRKMRDAGKAYRFHLLKGDPTPGIPRARIQFPDSSRKDRLAMARGDIPVLMLNSNLLKDALVGRLQSNVPGKGMYRYPSWMADAFFMELCAERRTDKGWIPTERRRNEAFDLGYYAIGVCVSTLLRAEQIDWEHPPSWAAPWDRNDLISSVTEPERFANPADKGYDFSRFAEKLA